MQPATDLPWTRLAAFIRQHTHDIRNDLNSLDLEASLLGDSIDDPEALEGTKRIRTQIRQLAGRLKALSAKFADPTPVPGPVSASDLFEIWKDQLGGLPEPPVVEWQPRFGAETLNVDAALLALVFRELLENAMGFGTGATLQASARVDGDSVVFELREPKLEAVEPAGWGNTPLQSTRRGGYGLGLWQVRRVIEASSGEIRHRFLPEEKILVTTLRFPIV